MNRRQLNIAILGLHYAPEPSGNAPYTTSLAEGLAAKGHNVRVLTGFPHYPEWKIRREYQGWTIRETIEGVRVMRLRHHVPRHPTALGRMHMELSFGLRLLFADWGNPDVVVLVSPALFSTGLAMIRARLGRKRPGVVVWVQDLYSRGIVETGGRPGFASRSMARLEGKILGSAHGVVAIHERFARYIVDALDVSPGSISVVRNWTHLPSAASTNCSETRKRLGWDDKDIIALHCGNMGRKQGLENVVAAARLAEETDSRVKFVLMGDGNQREALMSAAQGLTHLTFVDSLPQQDFQAALQAADVLLVNELPGVRDMSVPSKLTSYFTSGVPVVAATDEGSVTSEEIALSGAGIRVDAGNPSSLVAGIESLGNNPNLSKELGQNGMRFREKTLSESSAIAHYDDFIMSLGLLRGR
ncbi:glycosyltransferase family 4 protein [Arthrobacter sp. ISL-48]|uniref:glycosyltransferase family 4 protein n=1 Tax=Arthrobacter sp. ISL-48 TaxID=2819110 RepID=UPI00288A43FB|nr:glycosyltransferase family 4 protein [Arthrobacter sp. ISL-48]